MTTSDPASLPIEHVYRRLWKLLFAHSLILLGFVFGDVASAQTCVYEYRTGNDQTWHQSPEEAISSLLPCSWDSCNVNSQCAVPHHAELVSVTETAPDFAYTVQRYTQEGLACAGSGQLVWPSSSGSITSRVHCAEYFVLARPLPNSQDGACTSANTPDPCVADPINPATGSVFEVETVRCSDIGARTA